VREDNCWDVAVVQLGVGLVAKETVSQLTTSSNGNCIKLNIEWDNNPDYV
jgi:hypothetical protein